MEKERKGKDEQKVREDQKIKEERDRKAGGKSEKKTVKNGQERDKITEGRGLDNMHYRDSSGKMIFEDPILCSQFLNHYVDIPMLKDIKPEDIEDVTERYVHMFIEERNSDVVKKVHLKENSFYLVSLIEHKSDRSHVDVPVYCLYLGRLRKRAGDETSGDQ